MKQYRLISIFLLLSLLVSLCAIPVFAEPNQNTTAPEEASQESDTTTASDGEDATDEEAPTSDLDLPSKDVRFEPFDQFSVNGTAALLYEMNSGTILYAQNMDEQVYPASLTKIMTCLLALENGTLTDTLTVSETAISAVAEDARTDTVFAGEEIVLEDLLYYIMLTSSNEACNVVAEYIAGSIDEFVAMMNARAEKIGCTGTHFANANGLHDDNHYTTAYDLMLITREALQNKTFETICTSTEYEMPATNQQAAHTIHTTNFLTSTTQSYRYYYALAKGVKTGYTGRAGRCLISTAENDDLRLLSVVTGCPTTPDDDSGEYILENFTETVRLFEYGFSHFEFATVLSSAVPIAEVPVENGAQASVVIAPVQDTTVILPAGYDSSKITTEITLYGGNSIQAPVKMGDIVGVVAVYYDDEQISKSDIAPITDVEVGKAVYRSEEELAEAQKTTSKNPLSIWTCLIVLLFCLVVVYVVYYIYRNATRKKRRRKKSARKHTIHR